MFTANLLQSINYNLKPGRSEARPSKVSVNGLKWLVNDSGRRVFICLGGFSRFQIAKCGRTSEESPPISLKITHSSFKLDNTSDGRRNELNLTVQTVEIIQIQPQGDVFNLHDPLMHWFIRLLDERKDLCLHLLHLILRHCFTASLSSRLLPPHTLYKSPQLWVWGV